MPEAPPAPLLPEDLDRIARGLHPDPHSVLGPHGSQVRILRPGVARVRVRAGSAVVDARRVHASGLYVADLPEPPQDRSHRIETFSGVEDQPATSTLDAYAFEPSIGELDLHLFAEGKHLALHRKLGAHVLEHQGVTGTSFVVWAPNALAVRVVGNWNDWQPELGAMRRLGSGVWELFVPEIGHGALYKFEVMTRRGPIEKSDPFGRSMELRPQTASRVYEAQYVFEDAAWMEARKARDFVKAPISIYEVHLPSWRRHPAPAPAPDAAPTDETTTSRWLSYRQLAHELVDYVADLGFTHIELLPILEHPYDGSWGYQVSGYFAPTSRLGSPDDFRYFIDRCHARGLGVILDWVPAHFPRDTAALGRFDGTPLFEHWDPRRGEHRQWETFIFDWGRPEVKNFLVSSALSWLQDFHIDGLRVDAVASMLYLDYGANHPSEWEPNIHGGRENLEAVAFLRALNDAVHEGCPGALVFAEESTSWPGVTRPTYTGGLGFDFKWNMGWMHDTLDYFSSDPIFRSYLHARLTFGLMYAYSERYLLPLSHDEVVHLKRSLFEKIPGPTSYKASTLRALYAYMWAHPGKKLLFMGAEIGQRTEWNFSTELDWQVLADEEHRGVQSVLKRLNELYKEHPALHELDHDARGFQWIDANDALQSVASFIRFETPKLRARPTGRFVIFVGNFTPVLRRGYRVGVPRRCAYIEVLNTDAANYGGQNHGNLGRVAVEDVPSHGHLHSIVLTLPALSALYLVPEDPGLATDEELEAEAKARAARLLAAETEEAEGVSEGKP